MSASIEEKLLPAAVQFCPYSFLEDQPNIIVDGKEQRATVLTLSHWPWNQTPRELLRDTSTDIAFAYLDSPAHFVDAGLVSNSHYDEDGLLSMYALVDPVNAMRNRGLMIATSRAGDFSVCSDIRAAKLSFILAAYADPEISPLPSEVFSGTATNQIHSLYRLMLNELPGLMDNIDAYPHFWQDELQHWQESEAAIAEGRVVIDELPHLDMAIVRIPEDMPARTVRRYLRKWSRSVHPFAVHDVTHSSRIVWIKGASLEMQYRYESWVQLASRRPHMRVDLAGLADRLTDQESAGGQWQFEGVNEVAPRLRLAGSCRSSISETDFLQQLCRELESGPPAWDPYNRPE
jgi:hypothetical protein